MSNPLTLFPSRIAIGDIRGNQVFMTPEFYRALQDVLRRLGGASSNVPDLDQALFDAVMATTGVDADELAAQLGQLLTQPHQPEQDGLADMVFQGGPGGSAAGAEEGSGLPFQSVPVSTSPLLIHADRRCAINIDGPIIWPTLTLRRGADAVSVHTTLFELNSGDSVEFEFLESQPPVVTLIPR